MRKKNLARAKLVLIGIVVPLVLVGCASRKVRMTETGFLSDYSRLVEDEESGMAVYKNPDAGMAGRYGKIMIEPVEFRLDASARGKVIDPADKNYLTQYFHDRLKEKLSRNYEIVDAPGPGTLSLRAAITNIVPNIGVLNLNLLSLFSRTGFGGASLEAELLDSVTQERILTFVDARKGGKFKNGVAKWGHTEEALAYWADVMTDNIDQLRQ